MIGGNSSISPVVNPSSARPSFDVLAHDSESLLSADTLKNSQKMEELAKEFGFDSVAQFREAINNGQIDQEELANKVTQISGDPSPIVTRAPQFSFEQALQPSRLNKVGGRQAGGWINTVA